MLSPAAVSFSIQLYHHCHQCLLTSQINLFIWVPIFTFYTVKVNTDFENIHLFFLIFSKVSIQFYCINVNTWYHDELIHLRSQYTLMTVNIQLYFYTIYNFYTKVGSQVSFTTRFYNRSFYQT